MYALNLLCFLLLNLKMPKTNWGNKRVNIWKSQNDATKKQTGYLEKSNMATIILISFNR